MNRAPRPPKRSTTPTLSRRASEESIPATPTSPSAAKPLYLCSPFVEAALVKGNFKNIVSLPKYVDVNEWVAVNCEWAALLRREGDRSCEEDGVGEGRGAGRSEDGRAIARLTEK